MLSLTKQSINSQKKEILALAYQQFGATYVNVMNRACVGGADKVNDINRYDALKRNLHGHAHLRFCKAYNIVSNRVIPLDSKNYEYNYIYYTKSTTFDKRSKLEQKIAKNLSDCCFNIRKEVLDSNADLDNYYILVDTGVLFCLISKKEARENIIDTHTYNCRECYKVRLPSRFIRKADLVSKVNSKFLKVFGGFPEAMLSFDAKYIENDNYSSKYKASKQGFIKVENYLNGELQAVQYFISSAAAKDFFDLHGINHHRNYYISLARENGSIVSKDGSKEFIFSRVSEISDSQGVSHGETTVTNNNSSSSEPSALAVLFDDRENEVPLQYPNNLKDQYTVMDLHSSDMKETTKNECSNEELTLDIPKVSRETKREAKPFVMIRDLD